MRRLPTLLAVLALMLAPVAVVRAAEAGQEAGVAPPARKADAEKSAAAKKAKPARRPRNAAAPPRRGELTTSRVRLRNAAARARGEVKRPVRVLSAAEIKARAQAAKREARQRRLRLQEMGLAPAVAPVAAAAVDQSPEPAPAAAPVAAAAPPPAAVVPPPPRARRGGFLSRPVSTNAQLALLADVPPGFEEFLKPQQTLVDVYFGGTPLGTMMAEYTADGIEFQRPEELVERIPNVLNRTELVQRLKGRLPRNSDLVCQPGQAAGCGRLEPEVVGVIFDEARFRADVFVHPGVLVVQERARSRYLPPPADPEALTLVQNLTLVATRDDQGEGAHTLGGNTWLARGTDHIHAQWYNTREQSLAVDQLAWHRDQPDHSYTAGLFEARTEDLYFVQSALLAGGGAGRSLKLRTDIATESSTRLQIFLDTRSTVEIYRDGRLLASQFYEAGNQQLDTSGLPFGSYDIEIRIVDAAGQVRALNRFFIKTTQLAPPGEPQWYLEGGQVLLRSRDALLPEEAGTLQLRGGWRDRLRDNVGYAVAGAAVDTHAVAEGSLTWLHPRVSLTGGSMLSTQGDAGFTFTATGRWRDLTGSFSVREAQAAKDARTTSDYQLVAGNSSSRVLTLNYPVVGGQLSASVFQNSSGDTDSEIQSLRYTRNLLAGLFPPMFFNAQVARADGDLVASVGFDMAGFGEHWNWRVNPSLRQEEAKSGAGGSSMVFNGGIGWRDGERWAEDVEANLRTTLEDTATTTGLDTRVLSDYGRLQAGLDDIRADTGDTRRLNLRYETSLVATREHVGFGGRQTAIGSVLLDLSSAPEDSEFDIFIDGRRHFAVRGGRRVPLMLPAYRSYSISLADRGLQFLEFDGSARAVAIYPGTVATLAYKVERVVVAFGRLLQQPAPCAPGETACSAAPQPLGLARLLGTGELVVTDADGAFQAELRTGLRQLRAVKGGVECVADLPSPRWVNGILLLGDLVCTPQAAPAHAPVVPAAVPLPAPVTIPAPDPVPEPVPQQPAATTEPAPAAALAPAVSAVPAEAVVAGDGAVEAEAPATAPAAVVPTAAPAPALAPAAAASPGRPATAPRRAPPRAPRGRASTTPAASSAAVAAPPSADRRAERRERRERLRRAAREVDRVTAEQALSDISRQQAPRAKGLPNPLTRRERLRKQAKAAKAREAKKAKAAKKPAAQPPKAGATGSGTVAP